MTYSGLQAGFNESATLYDAIRPAYPQALIEAVLQIANLPASGRILEIGGGTGKATVPFAAAGYSLLFLEPGHKLAEVAARNLHSYPNVTIQEVTFEAWPVEESAFDLVIAAQSFHWIPTELGFTKAAQCLKPGGHIALFWNLSPDIEGPDEELWAEVQKVYFDRAREIYAEQGATPLTLQVEELSKELQANKGNWSKVEIRQFPWTSRYDTEQYIQLLNTYSNHLALPTERRKHLHEGIAQVIDERGGSVIKSYLSVLLAAEHHPS